MTNLNILEAFRTNEELLNHFEEKGQNIAEEEIENLKKSYEQAQENNDALSLKQLDDVAGGIQLFFLRNYESEAKAPEKGNDTMSSGKPPVGVSDMAAKANQIETKRTLVPFATATAEPETGFRFFRM